MDAYPPPLPPPLPSTNPPPEPSKFARQAANACLAAPIIMIALSASLNGILQNHRDGSSRLIFMIFGLFSVGLAAAGLVLGVLALSTARTGQRAYVVPRVVVGFVVVGLLVAIAVPNFLRARSLALQRTQALADLHTAAQDYRAQALASLTNADLRSANAERLQRSLSQAADKSPAETAAILRASQRYLQRLQVPQRAYENAIRALLAAKVLSPAKLEEQSQIQDRKTLIQTFLIANSAVKDFVQNGEANYRLELAATQVSPQQKQAAEDGFMKNYSVQLPLIIAVRDTDERLGRAMLEVLDLFDAQWGRWHYDAASNKVRFDDRDALAQYNAHMAEIKQAQIDQAAAQQRLATIVGHSATF